MVGIRLWMVVAIGLASHTQLASAGDCLSRADTFDLNSDTVAWSFVIPAGSECLHGLRAGTMLIDEVKIVEAPTAGTLRITGPAFLYRAPTTTPAIDHFKLQISGEKRRMRGSSVIAVDVTVR